MPRNASKGRLAYFNDKARISFVESSLFLVCLPTVVLLFLPVSNVDSMIVLQEVLRDLSPQLIVSDREWQHTCSMLLASSNSFLASDPTFSSLKILG